MSENQKRQPKGTENGGQFAASVNPESTVDLGDVGSAGGGPPLSGRGRKIGKEKCQKCGGSNLKKEKWGEFSRSGCEDCGANQQYGPVPTTVANHETGTFTLGDHTYQFGKTGPENDVTKYTLTNEDGGGGWRFEYDGLTRRVKAHGVRPFNPSAQWRDRGEVDIRTVARLFEPNAKLINLDGKTYRVDGPDWPLSESHLAGLSTGEMMLTGGKSEDDLREYVWQQRSDIEKSESERPELVASFAETRRFIDGIELAAAIGREAAEANTVGAMSKRGR